MTHRIIPSILAIALTAPAAASPGSVRDFQLPTPTPTAAPQVQGPVDVEGAVPARPRVIPTASPTAAPTGQPSPAPTGSVTGGTPSPAPAQTRRSPAAAPAQTVSAPQPRPEPVGVAPAPGQTALPPASEPIAADNSATETTATDDSELDAASPLPGEIAPVEAQSEGIGGDTGGLGMGAWLAALAAVLAILAGAFLFWRRQRTEFAAAPQIEPPLARTPEGGPAAAETDLREVAAPPKRTPPPAPSPAPAAVPSPAPAAVATPAAGTGKGKLHVRAEALSLSRSLMNATLAYRFELLNQGDRDLTDITVKADVVTAHGQAPIGDQIADAATELQPMSVVETIPVGDGHEVRGEFRLPISAIRTISQGQARLYVPLLRLRIDADGLDPIISTLVVGIKPAEGGAKLQPFRLDEMAQTYRNIGLRALS